MKDGPDGWDRWIAWNHRRKLKGSGVNVALMYKKTRSWKIIWLIIARKHQTNRQALGAAPAKKQKLGVQRLVRRKEIHDELEGHVFNQQRASEESGLGDSAKDIQTKAQKAFLQKEDSTQPFATLRRLQTEQDDSDWTDIGSTADEDEYAIV